MNASDFTGKGNEQEEEEKRGREMWMLTAERTPFSVVDQLAREVPQADETLVINGKTVTNQNSALHYTGSIMCLHLVLVSTFKY